MKEVTYEDWQKNPTPRKMWVWDGDKKLKVERKVVYILREDYVLNRVITTDNDDSDYALYKHCEELPKARRMTNKELAWWLTEKPHRECKFDNTTDIYSSFTYSEVIKDEAVSDGTLIREDDGEWREPLVEED